MKNLTENAEVFRRSTQRILEEMLGLTFDSATDIEETSSVESAKTLFISIYYTGTVYGEYLLAIDEVTAAKIIGYDLTESSIDRTKIREEICDTFTEMLNMIVGECLVHLQKNYAKLTLTPPRVMFGELRYPKFKTARSTLRSKAGDIECHFCLDLMRLDLATSYQEALTSLLDVNQKLRDANAHLAQQQAQLVHSEKMASIGMLASGVAHEINNPLFFMDSNLTTLNDYVGIIESMISLYEDLCKTIQTKDLDILDEVAAIRHKSESNELQFVIDDTQQLVMETREGVRRIRSIVNGLKEFSQSDLSGVAETDVNVLIRNTIQLLSCELGENRKAQLNLGPMPRVVCNAGEIQAIESHGTISVTTRSDEMGVSILIEDTGIGIPQDVLDRIFDPFFTTKPVGKGTGLGLSISYGIIRKHQGSISVESQVGQGTRLTMRLPLAGVSVEAMDSVR
jgi:signal transduction histidine kinase